MNQQTKDRPKRSLRWVLALWFLTFAIVPLVLLTFYSLRKFQQTIDTELSVRLNGNASEIKMILSDYQKSLARRQVDYLKDPSLQSLLVRNRKDELGALVNQWLSEASATAITLYDANGNLLLEKSKDPTEERPPDATLKRKYVSLHESIRQQLERKQIMTIPDYSNPQSLDLAMISPLYSGANLIGYLRQILRLDAGFLKRIGDRMQIQAVLIEPNGRITVGSHPDFLLYKSDFFADLMKIPNIKIFTLPLRGEPLGFVFVQIPWGDQEFPMALAASKRESNLAIDNLRVAYYTFLGIMFIVLALSVVAASNVFLRPLSELIEAIQDLHLGENIIELPIKSDNEIGQLTNSFNDLSRRILSAQRALKDKIRELELANDHLKETQGQLVQSAKMASLGQLVAGVAHELNNPIGFIYANMAHLRDYSDKLIQLVEVAENNPSRLRDLKEEFDIDYIRKDMPKLISSCEEGARRTKEIVIGLRNFSRIEEKSYQIVDIHQMLDNTLSLLNSEFKDRITVKKAYGHLPTLTCNQSQINQVLMNILSNASQAIEGKGTVWITTSREQAKDSQPERITIAIQDSGVGVAPEDLQKIFDPFFTTKKIGQGTGLGLAISYGIVHAHGGTIGVHSKLGKGSEFIITLPITPPVTSNGKT